MYFYADRMVLKLSAFRQPQRRVIADPSAHGTSPGSPRPSRRAPPAQLDSFLQDFGKLSKAKADWKYLFLAEPEAFEVLKKKYRDRIRGIRVVSLMGGNEFIA